MLTLVTYGTCNESTEAMHFLNKYNEVSIETSLVDII